MEVLVLDGKSYVKASKAAKELGYATDYVGQLCRSGQVDAHLIGRTWYVNQDELGSHKTEKKRMSRAKAREYAKKSIAEQKLKTSQTQNVSKNIVIRYEHDDVSLLPEVKKDLKVHANIPKKHIIEEEKEPELRFEHKGEHVLMRGSLPIVDVTDGDVDDDTTILHPTTIRVRHDAEAVSDESASKEEVTEEQFSENESAEEAIEYGNEDQNEHQSFTDRLQASGVSISEYADETSPDTETTIPLQKPYAPIVEKKIVPLWVCVVPTVVIFLFALLSLCIVQVKVYQPAGIWDVNVDTQYSFSMPRIGDILPRI